MKILGHDYVLIMDKDHSRREMGPGVIYLHMNEIRIDTGGPLSSREEALVHEIFEALKRRLDLQDWSHTTISALSEAWYMVLKDNPEIFHMGWGGEDDA